MFRSGRLGRSGAAPLQKGVVVCVLEARAHIRFCGRVCGVVKARATSTPFVAGSISAGGESCRISVVERWAMLGPGVPAARVLGLAWTQAGVPVLPGMVENGVTSS